MFELSTVRQIQVKTVWIIAYKSTATNYIKVDYCNGRINAKHLARHWQEVTDKEEPSVATDVRELQSFRSYLLFNQKMCGNKHLNKHVYHAITLAI